MKKSLVIALFCMMALFSGSALCWAGALYTLPEGWIYAFDPIVSFTGTPDKIDSIIAYGQGENASEATEQEFFESVLGLNPGDLDEEYYKDPSAMGQTVLDLFNPGFAWDYALIKVDGPNDFYYMFQDDKASGGDNLFTTPPVGTFIGSIPLGPLPTLHDLYYNWSLKKEGGEYGSYGISHASYILAEGEEPPNPPSQIPEPTTLLLLGCGLVALRTVLGRRR